MLRKEVMMGGEIQFVTKFSTHVTSIWKWDTWLEFRRMWTWFYGFWSQPPVDQERGAQALIEKKGKEEHDIDGEHGK